MQPTLSQDCLTLLETMIETPAVPGREALIRDLILSRAMQHELFDELGTDALGSLIGIRKPRGNASTGKPIRVMLSAHMDQIGFLVSHICETGILRVHPVGAFDPRTLVSQRIKLCCETGAVLKGVLMPDGHPVHTSAQGDTDQPRKLKDFHVDLGRPLGPSDKIRLGDMVVFDTGFADMGQSVAGPALDNRIGCWALMAALEQLENHDCEIIAVWSSQEELGSRGIEPVSFATPVDIGICCDTVVACDVPGVSDAQSVCKLGDGVALVVADSSTLSDITLVRQFERIATAHTIKTQRCLMEGGGQDGAIIQRSRDGVRTLVLGCPVRHMHTSNEIACKADMAAYVALLTTILNTL